MKKIIAAAILALAVAAGVAASPAQADDTESLKYFKITRIDWM